MKRRILCLLMALAIIVSAVPVVAFAGTDAAANQSVISVESVDAIPGTTVNVNINITNNPGILGATLKVTWDDALTLVSATKGDAFSTLTMTKPSNNKSGGNYIFYGEDIADEDIIDGSILKMTFSVSADVEFGSTLSVVASYQSGDVFDKNLESVEPLLVNGSVNITYLPGDVNSDKKINALDLILLCRYIADGCTTDPEGYNVTLNSLAGDVNADTKCNALDLILICRYIADGCKTDPNGYNITLKHSGMIHTHNMIKTEASPATCEVAGNIAYWRCTSCRKYYSDAEGKTEITLADTVIAAAHTLGAEATCETAQVCTVCGKTLVAALGHTEMVIAGYPATYEQTGLTDGVKCSVCGKVLVEQETIPVLEPDEYAISYIYEADEANAYLKAQPISNPNPVKYTTQGNRIILDPVVVPGFTFKGWFDKNGVQWDEIPKGTSGNLILYAHFELDTYYVNFDSPDMPIDSISYTVDKGATIINPSLYGYTFVGWSNDDGFIVNKIPVGTTGNITLHANWTSNRNRATSYSNYKAPIIIEDDINGQFLFVYDIGRIDNVPLAPYVDEATGRVIGVNGTSLNIDMTYTVTESFTSDEATEVIKTVADATTRSSGWTLSKEWNDLYSEGSEATDKQVKTEERVDAQGNVVGGNYFVSNSQGGSSFSSTECGASSSNSSKITTENSKGINASFDVGSEMYCDTTLGVSNSTEVSAGIKAPTPVGVAEAGVKNTTTVSAEVSNGRKDTMALHVDGSMSSFVGTNVESSNSSYFNSTSSSSSTWNSNSGYEQSEQSSSSTQISNAIANEIAKTTSYNVSKALGGENSETSSLSGTTSTENGYSNSLRVSEYSSKSTTKTIRYKEDAVGYYRIVTAGTIHVYGVVGYDVATSSYYTYTYNVLEDDTFEYVDYSKYRATFDDCENGLVTFEIPYEVNQYVLAFTGRTEGLEYDLDDNVTAFEPAEDFDGDVVIPQYYSVDNLDGTYSAHKTVAFSSETFRGNEDIKKVVLPIYITEIPDNAFEGCTNLEMVVALGVTSIGENAFKGCTSLSKFWVDNKVTYIGDNAFEGVEEIAVMAANSDVADAAINSGANKITVDLTYISDNYDNKTVIVDDDTDYFAIIGGGKTFTNLSIESDAKETFISNMTLTANRNVPVKVSSETLTLARTNIENAPGFALVMTGEDTTLKLLGTVNVSSNGQNAVLSKNVALLKANSGVSGKLNVTGKYLVCGAVTNDGMLSSQTKENLSVIDVATFEKYLSVINVVFDANGGEVSETSKEVYYGEAFGELPVPTREDYDFIGWYNENNEEITAESVVSVLADITLTAKWDIKTSEVIFNANEGSVSTDTKTVAYNETYGELPTPTRDYYTFAGWYTAVDGGERVTSDTAVVKTEQTTLFAHWTLNPLSDWVPASYRPEGTQLVNTKYTYTRRDYTTSDKAELPGWNQYNVTFAYTAYGPWSAWQDAPIYNSEFINTETQQVIGSYQQKLQYRYSRYLNYDGSLGKTWSNGARCYPISSGYCTYGPYYSDWSDSAYRRIGSNNLSSCGSEYSPSATLNYDNVGLIWFNQETRYTDDLTKPIYKTQYRYQERSKVYTYYFYQDVDNLESTTNPSGNDIFNVIEWVQYRNK